MKYKTKKIIYFALFQIVIFESCDNTYHLDSRDRMIVDTTANSKIAQITKNIADTARASHDKNVKRLSDSLVEFQLKAIEEKLNFSKQKR